MQAIPQRIQQGFYACMDNRLTQDQVDKFRKLMAAEEYKR